MKNRFYVIIPAAAFAAILLNALFGHLLFEVPHDQDINKYSIYVHLEPEWQSYPANMLFDITTVWSNPSPERVLYDTHEIADLESHNYNVPGSIDGRGTVVLYHQYSGCDSSWRPILYRLALDTVQNRLDYWAGRELNGDPYASAYPDIESEPAAPGTPKYLQFVPICTAYNITSYGYSLKAGSGAQFDVYFVPSEDELEGYIAGDFEYYPGCMATDHSSFAGICRDVQPGSGLLVAIPDTLETSLARITISMRELAP